MKRFDAERFLRVTAALSILRAMGAHPEHKHELFAAPSDTQRAEFFVNLLAARDDCEEMGLVMTAAGFERVIDRARLGKSTWADLDASTEEVQNRLFDESNRRTFLLVDAADSHLYLGTNLFGDDVAKKFPSTIDDIEEAGRCLALARPSACAFHCMRVVEHGLRVLGDSLDDASLKATRTKSWGRRLEEVPRGASERARGTVS